MSSGKRETWTVDTAPTATSIDDIHLREHETGPILKYVAAFALGPL